MQGRKHRRQDSGHSGRSRRLERWTAGLARLAAVVLAVGLAAPAARAVSYADADLYRFNDCSGVSCVATGLDLEAGDSPVEYSSIPALQKLSNMGAQTLNSPTSDYFLRINRTQLAGPTNPANVDAANNALFQYQFDVAWYGTINGTPMAPGEGSSDYQLLFSMVALRLGATPFSDPIDAGYLRTSFVPGTLDLQGVDILRDSPNGTLPAAPPDNWINDLAGGRDYLGINLPLVAPASGSPGAFMESDLNFVSFSFQMALRENILPIFDSGDAFQHVNAGFIRAVPEPGTALLLGAGLAGLAAVRRRR